MGTLSHSHLKVLLEKYPFWSLPCPPVASQVLDPNACPRSTRSAGSWWRPAGTATLPRGPCSASWSPACKASWSACATTTLSRKAAAWRTRTENTPDSLMHMSWGSWSSKYLFFSPHIYKRTIDSQKLWPMSLSLFTCGDLCNLWGDPDVCKDVCFIVYLYISPPLWHANCHSFTENVTRCNF